MSLSQRERLSKAHKGKKFSLTHRNNLSISRRKRGIVTLQTRQKLSKSISEVVKTPLYKERMRAALLGKKKSIEAVSKRSGSRHYNWKGGITPAHKKIRNSLEYKIWRKSVFERDDYTCVWCGQRGGELNADHIRPFALYPDLRLSLDNGRTLCVHCHRTTFGKYEI